MEMNTRVQVEHTITEEITGIDIVREQIRIASGLQLSVKQETSSTAATPCSSASTPRTRRTTSCPRSARSPATTRPAAPGVRTDTAIYTGYTIPPYYDSMCLKLIVWR